MAQPGFEDPLAPKRPRRVTGARVPPKERKRIGELYLDGYNFAAIARMTGHDRRQVSAICKELPNSSGDAWAETREVEGQPDPRPYKQLSPEARRALEDFGYFRARYFGRVATPWQEEAAYRVLAMLEEPEKTHAVINAPPASGKALALDTPIPTPAGWITMGEVEPGDLIMHPSGRPTVVVAKSEVMTGRECFKVITSDGHEVVADADHLWRLRPSGVAAWRWRTYTTRFIARPSPRHGTPRRKRLQVGLTAPFDLPEVALPVDPYVLGVFLGDGCWNSSSIAMTAEDAEQVRPQFEKAGYVTTDRRHPQQFGVMGLLADLRRAGLGPGRKFIPRAYLRASREQRLALLQGLMDSDGHVRPGGQCVFTNINEQLVRDAQELIHTLGAKGRVRVGYPESRQPVFNLFFYLEGCARLPRKADRTCVQPRSLHRGVQAEPTESVPVQCLQVAAPDGLFLVGKGLITTHNSSLFTHDVPAWMACRNRSVRCLIGSRTFRQAKWYTARLRRTFERIEVLPRDDEEVLAGRAVEPQASLVGDFGRFRPLTRFSTDLWRAEEFVIAQVGDVTISEKEASFAAFGFDGGYLGGRYRFIVWDDLVDRRNLRTAESRDALIEQYEDVAETRLEMGGLLLLQGQRLASNDLYRHCLDQTTGVYDEDEDEDVALPKKYRHVVYKSHYDEACRGRETHGRNAPYWRPPPSPPGEVLRGLFGYNPSASGCLLDPRRITWRELRQIKANRGQKFHTLYQQEDVDPEDVLVPRLWIDGGTDPATGETFPGCWDKGRIAGRPPQGLVAPLHSYVTVDPSPTMYWACLWWGYHPATEQRFLMDLARRKMDAPEFLDWNHVTGVFSGLADEWQLRSEDVGCRITHWIVEANAAQRFLLQYDHVRRWVGLRRVTIVPHQTQRNRTDPEFGIQSIAPLYRHGLVRLPAGGNHHGDSSRVAALPLVDEVTRYPDSATDDCVVSQWIGEYNLPKLFPRRRQGVARPRPSWLGPNVRALPSAWTGRFESREAG